MLKKTNSSASSVERAFAILETLDSSRRGMNISEIGRKMGIPKSTTHVLITTLENIGYLRKERGSRNYFLGLKAYAFGQGMMKNIALSEAALPNMQALVDKLRLSSHLAIIDKDQGVYIQKVEAPGLIRFDTYVGRRMDLHCTGVGKVILAYEESEALEHFLSKKVFVRYTKKTIISSRKLRKELTKVRQVGFAVDDEEEELNVRCVAVPVFNRDGKFVAALSVTGTSGQIPTTNIQYVVDSLKDTTAEILRLR